MFNISGNVNFDGVGNVKSSHVPLSKPAPKHAAVMASQPPVATVRPAYMQSMGNGNYTVTASDYIAAKGVYDIPSSSKQAKIGVENF